MNWRYHKYWPILFIFPAIIVLLFGVFFAMPLIFLGLVIFLAFVLIFGRIGK